MSAFPTLNAFRNFHESISQLVVAPFFETALFFVPQHPAFTAFFELRSGNAVADFVACFVAFEAEFLVAVEGRVAFFSAQKTSFRLPLIGAIEGFVAVKVAVETFDRWVFLDEVAVLLRFQAFELVHEVEFSVLLLF